MGDARRTRRGRGLEIVDEVGVGGANQEPQVPVQIARATRERCDRLVASVAGILAGVRSRRTRVRRGP